MQADTATTETADSASGKAATLSWPLNFTLGRPAAALGETIGELNLKEPTAGDLLKFGFMDGTATGESSLDLIAHLAGKPPAAVRALPGVDMLRLTTMINTSFAAAMKG